MLSVTCPTRFRTEVGQAHASAGLRRSYSAKLSRTVRFAHENDWLSDNAACSLMVAACGESDARSHASKAWHAKARTCSFLSVHRMCTILPTRKPCDRVRDMC